MKRSLATDIEKLNICFLVCLRLWVEGQSMFHNMLSLCYAHILSGDNLFTGTHLYFGDSPPT